MAEALLRQFDKDIAVKSAGTHAMNGQGCSHNSAEVLREHNLSFEHSSSQLTKEDLDWATHVFTMTEGHKSTITHFFPEYSDKIFTLKEFVNDDKQDRDILDPFGGSLEIYRETYKELSRLVQQLVKKLNE